ncbi:hypothetical protein PSU4_26110 [Pseudonocardia sulfidoxydans NBRC 16205]|uniref:Uncharacterized protein n=1 Tax=Pseudonocardia sulfidoxydans NBRC 16205 TaxID=1223511 RepID=A0A511DGL1_9PSEU|nr:hypothetical protein [Pseudonocardia sulfidoxydans]GEL23657.1 hypothetical protein PSU4_26110 [Pseudonocardia sulfidoxydans NBRC 16205]
MTRAVPSPPSASPSGASPRERRRADIAARLLDGLESLLTRHRALLVEPDISALHAELIAAEVAHELELARAALQRTPSLTAVPAGPGARRASAPAAACPAVSTTISVDVAARAQRERRNTP